MLTAVRRQTRETDMGCCGTNTTGAGAVVADTNKRVNYTKGMLLGVDDFVQEQAWHIARRHELAREVLGYGTVRGLKVDIEGAERSPPGPPVVRVSPGLAYVPSGAPVCVGSEQCCDINAWLQKHWAELPAEVNGAVQPAPLRLHVVLSYLAVPSDPLPVPGEPCRDEADLTANSRLTDCFKLELRLQPPDQIEEDAVRDFADWLAQVPVASSSPPMNEADFMAQLRAAAADWLQPVSPNPADYMFGSPPAGLGSSDALLQAALRLWVTELRPLWRARYGCGPLPTAPGGPDDAVLLATLDLRVYAVDRRAEPEVAIVEDRRPLLLSLRMVQELITQNPAPEPGASVEGALAFGLAPVLGSDTAYARADHHHGTPPLPTLGGDALGPIGANEVRALRGVPLAAAAPLVAGQVLTVQGAGSNLRWQPVTPPAPPPVPPPVPVPGPVVAQTSFGLGAGDGGSGNFARADHTHGTPGLVGDVVTQGAGPAQQVRVVRLQGRDVSNAAPANRQVLAFNGSAWAPADPATGGTPVPPLGGDLSGPVGTAFVESLQRVPLRARTPARGDVLTFDGNAWVPGAAAGGGIQIIAAGVLELDLAASPNIARVLTSAGRDSARLGRVVGGNQAEVDLSASGIPDLGGERSGFMVKLTPVWHERSPVLPYLVSVRVSSTDALRVAVMLFCQDFLASQYQVHYEISRYQPFRAQ